MSVTRRRPGRRPGGETGGGSSRSSILDSGSGEDVSGEEGPREPTSGQGKSRRKPSRVAVSDRSEDDARDDRSLPAPDDDGSPPEDAARDDPARAASDDSRGARGAAPPRGGPDRPDVEGVESDDDDPPPAPPADEERGRPLPGRPPVAAPPPPRPPPRGPGPSLADLSQQLLADARLPPEVREALRNPSALGPFRPIRRALDAVLAAGDAERTARLRELIAAVDALPEGSSPAPSRAWRLWRPDLVHLEGLSALQDVLSDERSPVDQLFDRAERAMLAVREPSGTELDLVDRAHARLVARLRRSARPEQLDRLNFLLRTRIERERGLEEQAWSDRPGGLRSTSADGHQGRSGSYFVRGGGAGAPPDSVFKPVRQELGLGFRDVGPGGGHGARNEILAYRIDRWFQQRHDLDLGVAPARLAVLSSDRLGEFRGVAGEEYPDGYRDRRQVGVMQDALDVRGTGQAWVNVEVGLLPGEFVPHGGTATEDALARHHPVWDQLSVSRREVLAGRGAAVPRITPPLSDAGTERGVQRAAILDALMLQLDRNPGNVVQVGQDGFGIIDNASGLNNLANSARALGGGIRQGPVDAWFFTEAAAHPFDPAVLGALQSFDPDQLVAAMQQEADLLNRQSDGVLPRLGPQELEILRFVGHYVRAIANRVPDLSPAVLGRLIWSDRSRAEESLLKQELDALGGELRDVLPTLADADAARLLRKRLRDRLSKLTGPAGSADGDRFRGAIAAARRGPALARIESLREQLERVPSRAAEALRSRLQTLERVAESLEDEPRARVSLENRLTEIAWKIEFSAAGADADERSKLGRARAADHELRSLLRRLDELRPFYGERPDLDAYAARLRAALDGAEVLLREGRLQLWAEALRDIRELARPNLAPVRRARAPAEAPVEPPPPPPPSAYPSDAESE